MNREERKARRKKLADYVAAGNTCEEAATAFGLTVETCRIACREFKVTPTRNRRPGGALRPSSYVLLAKLITTAASYADIATAAGVTKATVSDLAARARAAGIPLHPERL